MRRSLVPVALLLLLAACHSSGSDGRPSAGPTDATSATTSSTPGTHGPACTDIWRAGATLPKHYTTCSDGAAAGAQDVTKCKDGTTLVAYSDLYYAVTGGTISKPKEAPMQDTPAYGKVYTACTGEQ